MAQDARFRRPVQAGRRFSVKIGLMRISTPDCPHRRSVCWQFCCCPRPSPSTPTGSGSAKPDTSRSSRHAEGAEPAGRRRYGTGLRRAVRQHPDRAAHAGAARLGARHARRTDLDLAGPPPRAARRDGDRRRHRASCSGLFASSQWQAWLMFQHAQPFGESDPILGHDIGFYVFRLPFLELLRGLPAGAGARRRRSPRAPSTCWPGALNWSRGARIGRPARRHLAALAACASSSLAFGAYLDVPELLIRPAGIVHGVANVDDAVRIPALRALMVAARGRRRRWRCSRWRTVRLWPIGAAVLLYLVVAIGGSVAAGADAALRRSRRTSRRARRRTSSTTSPPRGRRSRSTASRSASCRATRR